MTPSRRHGSFHIMADLYGCRKEALVSYEHVCATIENHLAEVGMNIRQKNVDVYPGEGSGYQGYYALEDSWLMIECWPEYGMVKINIDLCNYNKENTENCRKLYQYLQRLFKASTKDPRRLYLEVRRGPLPKAT